MGNTASIDGEPEQIGDVALVASHLFAFSVGILTGGLAAAATYWLLGAASGYAIIVGILIAPLLSLAVFIFVTAKITKAMLPKR